MRGRCGGAGRLVLTDVKAAGSVGCFRSVLPPPKCGSITAKKPRRAFRPTSSVPSHRPRFDLSVARIMGFHISRPVLTTRVGHRRPAKSYRPDQRETLCMLTLIHPRCAFTRPPYFQAHLVLETSPLSGSSCISLHFSPRGEAKWVRGPSGRGASRLARAGVLDST